jgi:hypothetical protein
MGEGASDRVTAAPAAEASANASPVDALEAEVARTRERLSATLGALNGEVQALLDTRTPLTSAPQGTRSLADVAALSLRATGHIRAIAQRRRLGQLALVTAIAGLAAFVLRAGLARRRQLAQRTYR